MGSGEPHGALLGWVRESVGRSSCGGCDVALGAEWDNDRDWEPLALVTRALRRLNGAVVNHGASDEALVELAHVVDAHAAQVETGAPRVRATELMSFPHMRAIRDGTKGFVQVGERVEFDPFSLGGGYLHPASIGFDARRVDDTSLVATTTVHPMFQGPPGRVHGGILALLVDEIFGTLNVALGLRALTARLAVSYLAAAPIDVELTFRASIQNLQGRNLAVKAEGTSPQGPFLEAEALFITVDLDKAFDFDPEP